MFGEFGRSQQSSHEAPCLGLVLLYEDLLTTVLSWNAPQKGCCRPGQMGGLELLWSERSGGVTVSHLCHNFFW